MVRVESQLDEETIHANVSLKVRFENWKNVYFNFQSERKQLFYYDMNDLMELNELYLLVYSLH